MAERLLVHHAVMALPAQFDTRRLPISLHVGLVVIPHLLGEKTNGEITYPFLKNFNARRKFEKALIKAGKIYESGDFETIPDKDRAKGTPNSDFICQACGNFTGGICKWRINEFIYPAER